MKRAKTKGRICAVAFAAGVAAACGDAPTPGSTFATRDSLGVEIVESAAPLWAEGEGWTLADEPELVIGTREGDERYLLADVRGARRLPDGGIAVLDAGSTRVRVYAADGQHRFDLGGAGDGPSEFRNPQFMDVIGDTIVVYEYFSGSLTWFSSDGEFIRTTEIPRTADGSIIRGMVFGILRGRDAIAMGLPGDIQYTEGLNRFPLPLWRFGLRGDSLALFRKVPGFEQTISFPRPGRTRHSEHIFGKWTLLAASDQWVYVAPTDDYTVEVLDSQGALRRMIRRSIERRPVARSDVDRYVSQRIAAEGVPADERAAWDRSLREGGAAETMPAFRWIAVDAEDDLWVEEWEDVGLGQGAFSVFRPDGAWLGAVEVPDGLPSTRGGLFQPWVEIGSDYFLGVWVGELGVEQVRFYPILKR